MNNFLKGFFIHQLIKKAQEPGTSKPSVPQNDVTELVGIIRPWRGFVGPMTPRRALETVYGSNLDRVISLAQNNLTRYTAPQDVGFSSWKPEYLQREIPIWQLDKVSDDALGKYLPARKYILIATRPTEQYREDLTDLWDAEARIFPEQAKSKEEREKALWELWNQKRYNTLMHELTHAFLLPEINKKFPALSDYPEYTKHLLRDFPAHTLGSPVELDPRLAELKRKYYQATGRIINTPEEAERAFDWLDRLYHKYYGEASRVLYQRFGSELSHEERMDLATVYATAKLYTESSSFPSLRSLYWHYRGYPGSDFLEPKPKDPKYLWDIILQRMTQLAQAQNEPKDRKRLWDIIFQRMTPNEPRTTWENTAIG